MPCWKVYLRIDRAYGLAGNKVGKVCSRKSFGRQGKFLAVLPAVSFQALLAWQDWEGTGRVRRGPCPRQRPSRKVSSVWGVAIRNASGRLSLTTLSAAQTKLRRRGLTAVTSSMAPNCPVAAAARALATTQPAKGRRLVAGLCASSAANCGLQPSQLQPSSGERVCNS